MTWLEWLVFACPGLIIGVATLPWKHQIDPRDSTLMYLLGWASLWPFLTLWFLKDFLKYFTREWFDYVARARHEKSK